LRKLNGDLPPCMLRFRDKGGSVAIGRFDNNSMTLRTYCNSAGLSDQKADDLATWLVEHTNPDIETTKDSAAKEKHWRSIRETPACQEPFSCALLLRAKQELQFDCSACLAIPEGVMGKTRANGSKNSLGKSQSGQFNSNMFLPEQLSQRLLAYLLQSGANVSEIVDEIFKDSGERAIVRAFSSGCKDVVDIFRYWDSQTDRDRNPYFSG
jgi:hypothetical protein